MCGNISASETEEVTRKQWRFPLKKRRRKRKNVRMILFCIAYVYVRMRVMCTCTIWDNDLCTYFKIYSRAISTRRRCGRCSRLGKTQSLRTWRNAGVYMYMPLSPLFSFCFSFDKNRTNFNSYRLPRIVRFEDPAAAKRRLFLWITIKQIAAG